VATQGRRARRGPLVVHVIRGEDAAPRSSGAARAGIVVGRRVGPAVTRNLVKRRLREQLRTRLPLLPEGTMVVVRAMPPAATASFERLGASLDGAFRSLDVGTEVGNDR
jgi:ribonuclease P protein component